MSAAAVRSDTIVAPATAAGHSAIAVVRLSGPAADTIAARCAAPWPPVARRATRCAVHEPDQPTARIDDALAIRFPAPASYTGETIVEFQVHGSPYVTARVVAALVAAGARPALPGEFTERAVRAGKLDLLRAEAIQELIVARTAAAHRAALDAVSGATTRAAAALRRDLLQLNALIAFDIDFPEEDDGRVPRARVTQAAHGVLASLRALLATVPAATVRRDGAVIVLAGPPNAGKSSLFNALLGHARAIVSDEPGTTRDAIEALLDEEPWPWRLVDTAGIRDGAGTVEQLGIEVSRRYLSAAHVVIACGETTPALDQTVAALTVSPDAQVIRVRTKADVRSASGDDTTNDLRVSVRDGTGLENVRTAIRKALGESIGDGYADGAALLTARQRAAIDRATDELEAFAAAWDAATLPAPVVATHLHAAGTALDDLIGGVTADDVLGEVFRGFCVGK